ncbi:MAG: hypothetical protein E7398_00320 [Ruminococcaceae bacterium]|nr:hypothetical protein [Oscillospiraceae bacterium]
MIYFLNLDNDNYLLSVATIGQGTKAEIDLTEYDLTGNRIRAHKWENGTLIFDEERLAEIEAQSPEIIPKEETGDSPVYDELAAAYKEGVQEA